MKTYKESQKLDRLPIMFVLIPLSLLLCIGVVWQVILGHQFGNRPSSNLGLIILAFLVNTLTIVWFFISLKTEITETGIKYGFTFIFLAGGYISWSEISEVRFITFPYIGEGIRLVSDLNATAYIAPNCNGSGIFIIRKDGKRNILISTQQIIAITEFIKTLKPDTKIAED